MKGVAGTQCGRTRWRQMRPATKADGQSAGVSALDTAYYPGSAPSGESVQVEYRRLRAYSRQSAEHVYNLKS